jgi:tight adherence protein C
VVQQRLAQAGIRKKEWAVAVIFGGMIGPIVLGGWRSCGSTCSISSRMGPFKRFMGFAVMVIFGYKAPTSGSPTSSPSAPCHPQGPARRARPAGDLRRSGPDRGRAAGRVARELGRAYPNWAMNSR